MKPPSTRQHILVGAQIEGRGRRKLLFTPWPWLSLASPPNLESQHSCTDNRSDLLRIPEQNEDPQLSRNPWSLQHTGDSGDNALIPDSPPLLCETTIVGLLHHTEEDELITLLLIHVHIYVYILTFKIHMLSTWMNIYYYIWIYIIYSFDEFHSFRDPN